MPRELLQATIPPQFKEQYPWSGCYKNICQTTKLPELEQMIFTTYKNDHTYKGVISIYDDIVITFISELYPHCISDKELTMGCCIFVLIKTSDYVMADRGFDIGEDLTLYGVRLNIPPLLHG